MSQATDYPSVTEILRAVGLGPTYDGVPTAVLEKARLRGQALHAAIQYHAEGSLDDSTIHPEVALGFSAYLKFLAETGHEPVGSEIEIVHAAWRYVGHIDRVGLHKTERVLIDFKFTDSVDTAASAFQLAGYRLAWTATRPAERIDRSWIVQLKHDGTYRVHDVPRTKWPQHEQVFLAALVVYRARQETPA